MKKSRILKKRNIGIVILGSILVLFASGTASRAQLVCTETVFEDVNVALTGLPYCHFIERFAGLGITGGCRPDDPATPGNQALYCPDSSLTRAQMAIFLTTALDMVPGILSEGPCQEGQVLKKTATGFTCSDESSGGGTPSISVTPLDGTPAAGTSSQYSRGDHKHGIAAGAVTGAHILDSTITNADISPSAAIDYAKLSGVASSTHNHDAAYVNESQANSITSAMIVNGTIALADMGQNGCANGQVMKWNGSAWACAGDDVGTGADNLGNHIATQNIRLGAYWLSGDGGNEGISVDSTGTVTIRGDLKTDRWINSDTNTFVGAAAAGGGLLAHGSSEEGWHNTAMGHVALYSNTTGSRNSAIGAQTLQLNTTGTDNAAMGSIALSFNTTGFGNSAMGAWALRSNTTGTENSAMGYGTLYNNTTASRNSAIGKYALFSNTTGSDNSALGMDALRTNTIGSNNSAAGRDALYSNTTGYSNSAVGRNALRSNTTGYDNSAMGMDALRSNTTGTANVAFGNSALFNSGTGSNNSAFGAGALFTNSTGGDNTAAGWHGMYSNTAGTRNVSVGRDALYTNSVGNDNTAVGYGAGYDATGSGNVFLGQNAGRNETGSYKLYINNSQATPLIYGDFAAERACINCTDPANTLDVNGQLTVRGWASASATTVCRSGNTLSSCSSSLRYKEEIADLGMGMETVEQLRPVTFKWIDRQERDLGFIAEEVEEIAPLLVEYRDGQVEGVKYSQMTAVLVKALQELKAENDALRVQNNEFEKRLARIEELIGKETR